MAEVAEAVHHAHMRGILHRDLKPANILLDADDHPQVTDFGLAKRVEGDAELTQSGAILGTPAYMAPEQAEGRRGTITTATDVHGLGAILYALLTGQAPFAGESVVDTLQKVRDQPPDAPRKLNPKLPTDLEVICLKCLEKDPRRRYAGAQAVADDLQAWLASRPIAARPVGPIERATLFLRRKPVLATAYALTAAVVLLIGFGGSLVWLWRDAEKARGEAVVARDGEARAKESLASIEYGRTIQVAYHSYWATHVATALDLLDKTRADLRGWEWYHVHRLCHSDLITLKGHSSNVNSASYSPEGTMIITGSRDQTAKVWDASTGAEILTLQGHGSFVNSASFSPDGTRLVTASDDKTARVWDAKTGTEILSLNGHSDNVTSASFSPDGSRIVTSSNDRISKVWDAKTGAEILSLKGHIYGVNSAAFSPDGSRIVTASYDHTAKVWDARAGAEILSLKGHSACVVAASFSPDGSQVLTASDDWTAKVWDARSGAEILNLKGHTYGVNSAAFSPDGSLVVTASDDMTAKVWDAKTGEETLNLQGHTSRVESAAFSPDGSRSHHRWCRSYGENLGCQRRPRVPHHSKSWRLSLY